MSRLEPTNEASAMQKEISAIAEQGGGTTKVEQLIQQYCPDGVEYVKLGDVVSISRGASPRPIQNYLTDEEDGIPWIKIGDVSTNSKYITSTAERITREGANKSRFLKKGTFILSNSMSFGRPYILGIDGCIHDGWISICDFKTSLNSDFLYYLLRSSNVQAYWISKANSGGAVTNLNSDIVRSTPIPIPPLPVQEEIVRILDTLTELQAELQAELQKRKQQYEYYRDKLLSFSDLGNWGGRNVSVEWKKIKEVYQRIKGTPITAGKMKEIQCPTGEIRIFAGGKTVIDANEADIPNANITRVPSVLVQSRGVIDAIYYDKPFTFKNEMWAYTHKEQTSVKFLYYIMKQNIQHFRDAASGMGALPQISLGTTEDFIIPVPPFSVQKQIVDILDRFDTLTNDLTAGLPAEIEARRKQYEYYRDRLLTFNKKNL